MAVENPRFLSPDSFIRARLTQARLELLLQLLNARDAHPVSTTFSGSVDVSWGISMGLMIYWDAHEKEDTLKNMGDTHEGSPAKIWVRHEKNGIKKL